MTEVPVCVTKRTRLRGEMSQASGAQAAFPLGSQLFQVLRVVTNRGPNLIPPWSAHLHPGVKHLPCQNGQEDGGRRLVQAPAA